MKREAVSEIDRPLRNVIEKFDLLADAPNAVSKMRAMILKLAMRGCLVEQEPAEGNGGNLQKRLATYQVDHLRPGASSDAEQDDEGWYGIPQTWCWTRLKNVAKIVGGGTPRSHNAAYFSEHGIPWLTPADLSHHQGKFVTRGRRCITELGLKNSSAQLLPEGAVLFSSRAPIGYVAIAGTELATNQGFKNCVPFIREMSEFLYYYLASVAARVDAEAPGTTFREVSAKLVRQIPCPLPPLAEQKRIVAKVDELMGLCDRLEEQQRERETRHAALARASLARFTAAPTGDNLDYLFHKSYGISPAELRKAILTLAVRGQLTAPRSPPSETPLGSMLADASLNGVSKGPTSDTDATEVLRISAGTSRDDFFVDEDDYKYVELSADEIEKFSLAAGDLLACRFNGNLHFVGRFSYYRGSSGRVQVNPDKLIRFRLDFSRYCPRYVCFAMNAAPTRLAIEAMCATTAGNIGLSAGRLKTVTIPVPPLEEQRAIVAAVERLFGMVSELERQVEASKAASQQVLEALIATVTSNA